MKNPKIFLIAENDSKGTYTDLIVPKDFNNFSNFGLKFFKILRSSSIRRKSYLEK